MAESLQTKERFVAKKLWIAELLAAEFKNSEGQEQPMLFTSRGQAGRVNILGVVIAKEELPVSTITIDDGTGQVHVRSFERPLGVSIGSIVQVIGRPRQYQGSMYVSLVHLSKLDAAWLEFRKAELGDILVIAKQTPPSQEEIMEENNAEKLLRLIKQLDDGEGADIDKVIEASKLAKAEDIINQMLMHGDIFELRPGRIKIL